MGDLRDLRISARTTLPARLLSVRFSRSGGPGGQNVNKVETKVTVRFTPRTSAALTPQQIVRIDRGTLASPTTGATKRTLAAAAHRLRDGEFSTRLDELDGVEDYDLVIVGGGMAGLGAAFEFKEQAPGSACCLVLENHAVFGGVSTILAAYGRLNQP